MALRIQKTKAKAVNPRTETIKAQLDCVNNKEKARYKTYYQRELAQIRNFVPVIRPAPKTAKYRGYPTEFEFIPESHDNEPNRIGDFKIDLDADKNIEATIKEAHAITNYFKDEYGVPNEEWRIWFSGGKGIHLELKASVLGLGSGRQKLPLVYKNMMKGIIKALNLKTADLSIYCMKTGKPFRLENVKRENGNYKVPITFEELVASNHDEFVKSERHLEDTRKGIRNENLVKLAKKIEIEIEQITYKNEGKYFSSDFLKDEDEPNCIEVISQNRKVIADKCDFNFCMQTLTRWNLDCGYGFEEAMDDPRFEAFVLNYPSSSLTTPEARKENVRNRFSSMETAGSSFGCGYAKALGLKMCDGCPVHMGVEQDITELDYAERAKRYLEKEAKRVGELDQSILPQQLQDHINEGLERAKIDPLMLLHGALGAAAAALGKRARCKWFGGSYLYPNLYSLLIGDSGTGKSTAISVTMKDILRITNLHLGIIKEEQKKEEPDLVAIKLYEGKLLSISQRITLEALVARLNKHDGIIASAEFGGFLKSLRSGGNVHGMMELLSDIYDCPDYWSKETVSGGTMALSNPCLSIVGYSTLEFIEGVLSSKDIGSGALARYLLLYPQVDDSIPPALPTYALEMPEMSVYDTFTQMNPVEMVLSTDATKRYEEIFEQLHKDLRSTGERAANVLEPFLKRWGANIIKVAMIFQQLEEPKSTVIEIKSLEGAWHVVGLAVESTKLLFDGKIGLSEHQEKCSRVLMYIAKKGGKVTRKQIAKNGVLNGGVKDLDYVLESLLAAGTITFKGSALTKPDTEIYLNE